MWSSPSLASSTAAQFAPGASVVEAPRIRRWRDCGYTAAITLPFALVGALAFAAPELAEPSPPPHEIDLTWDAPPECPSAEEIEARYRFLLSGPPVGDGTLVASAKVRREAAGLWVLRLTTSYGDATDSRVLEASGCGELADGVAMVFAVALEPGLDDAPDQPPFVAPPQPAAEAPTSPQVPEPGPIRPARVQKPTSTSPRPPRTMASSQLTKRSTVPAPTPFARLGVGAERGALPGAAVLPGFGLGLLWPRAQLEADVSWLAPRSFDAPVDDSSALTFNVRAQSIQGAVRGCYVLRDGAISIPLCAALEAGRTFARSRGLTTDSTLRGPWLAAGLRAALRYRWRRIGVYAAGEVLRSLVTTRLRVVQTPLFTPSALSVRGIAGVELFFLRSRP